MGKLHVIRYFFFALTVVLLMCGQRARAADKRPVPDAAKQQETLGLLKKELFKKEYEAANTAAKRLELTQALLKQASQSKNDQAGYFVLLQEASEMAVAAGDVELAMQAIDELGKNYAVNPLSLKFKAMDSMTKGSLQAPQAKALAEMGLTLVGDAVALDNFSGAKAVGDLAMTAARKSGDKDLIKQVTNRIKEIDEDRAAFDKIKDARDTLTTSPDDPAANTVVGKYRCFVKEDWDKGLVFLARCDAPALRAAARADLLAPSTAEEQSKVGDLWWDAASGEKADAKTRIQSHAARWYEEALPSLTGLTREKIDRRLAESAKLPKGAVLVFGFDNADFIKKNGRVFIKDLSGRGNTGELIGGGAFAPQGKVGGALTLDGKQAYVTVPNVPALNWEQFTLSMWVKFGSKKGNNPVGGQILFTKKDNTKFWVDTFGYIRVEIFGNKDWRGIRQDGGVEWKPGVDQWIHFVGRFDGKGAEVFADGKSVSKTTRDIDDKPKPNSELLNIGQKEGGFGNFLNGTIDEVAVFNRALSDAEVLTLYRLGQYGKGMPK